MTVWSFTHGFIGGFFIAYFYNLFAKKFNWEKLLPNRKCGDY
jgi:hypothetical protein